MPNRSFAPPARFFCALSALMLVLAGSAFGQAIPDITDEARSNGYMETEDGGVMLVFDAGVYGVEVPPEGIVVTGGFRGWTHNLADPTWKLKPHPSQSGVLTLAVPDTRAVGIGPRVPFKFRLGNGTWLDAPATATNTQGTDLLFFPEGEAVRFRAEVLRDGTVWATVEGTERPMQPEGYRLTRAGGEVIELAEVLPHTAETTLLIPATPIDIRGVHYLELLEGEQAGLTTLVRRDGYFRTLYSHKPLGAEIRDDGSATDVRIFAPRAEQVDLYLYDTAEASYDEGTIIPMTMDAQGVWEAELEGDHHGTYYDFRVYGGDLAEEPGNHFWETTGVHVGDPYARVSLDTWGKGRIWRATEPSPGPVGGRPAMEDVIAYEVHVQDFTDLLPVDEREKGTMPAFHRAGLTNEHGEPIGFDYLLDLGINVVHLMPVQEYLHYTDEEWSETFGDDEFAQAMGIADENYQWGYRTTYAFAVESRFRPEGTEPGSEREMFRDLVRAFHERGIAVIIDIVPNHTGENMDGRFMVFNFNGLDMPYYYRTSDSLRHIGPFGNEVKTEERPMTQRWIIDQALHWVDEFGVDGFRVDLAGQLDEQTMLKFMEELPEDIIVYGEPWIDVSDPDVLAEEDWDWYKIDSPIPFFQDAARNTLKGPTSFPHDKFSDRGFAGGDKSLRADAMIALQNYYEDEIEGPNEGVQYLDIHDNWALPDRFARTEENGLLGVDEGALRIGAGMLFTSLGPLVINGGTEMLRSKGVAPHDEFVRETATGPIYFKGRDDTYNLRTPNQYLWDTLGDEDFSGGDASAMRDFWRGLIDIRMSEAGEVFRTAERVPEGYYVFTTPPNEAVLGYVVDGTVAVALNAGVDADAFEMELPAGEWRLVANSDDTMGVADLGGVDGPQSSLGGGTHRVELPAWGFRMWVRQ
jgi:pullulanase/glycogen debranching enzyme